MNLLISELTLSDIQISELGKPVEVGEIEEHAMPDKLYPNVSTCDL